KAIFWGLVAILVISITFRCCADNHRYLGGSDGAESNDYLIEHLGYIGTILCVTCLVIFFLILSIKVSLISFTSVLSNAQSKVKSTIEKTGEIIEDSREKINTEVSHTQTTENKVSPSPQVDTPLIANLEDKAEVNNPSNEWEIKSNQKSNEAIDLSFDDSLKTSSFDIATNDDVENE